MKVLVVSQQYPPYPVVGALRAKKVAEMFRARGHSVTVVTERLKDEQGDVRLDDGKLRVRTVFAGLPYRLRFVAFRDRLRGRSVELSSWDGPGSSAPATDDVRPATGIRRAIGAVRGFAIGILRLPDDQQHFVHPAYQLSREIAEQGVDLVYTTVPAFSTHFVGLLLRRRRSVRWIAEFRDPWTTDASGDRHGTAALLHRLNRWMERQCLVHADVIVAVTESVGRQLAAKLPPEQRGKVVVAMNGIEELLPRRTRRDANGPYRIVYTGSFYSDRDPRPFLTALAEWVRAHGLGATDVQVDFAGRCRHYGNISVEEITHDLGLADIVNFHDWLPTAAVQELLTRADLVLLLARSQPAQVPNKLFEYLGVRAPILALIDRGGESERILNAVGGQFVITPPDGEPVTAPMLRDALELAYARRHEAATTNDAALASLMTARQFDHLATALGV